MSDGIKFTLDGREVVARDGETIWEVAKREGTTIPHLCHKDQVGYRSDGNCRACMVEVEGERTLTASCVRAPSEGMVVNSDNARAKTARKMVMELLVADQPARRRSRMMRRAISGTWPKRRMSAKAVSRRWKRTASRCWTTAMSPCG